MSELLDRLPPADRDLVLQCGRLAAARGTRAFLVGGAVRDLLLATVSPDLDILIVGDAIVVAQDFARARGGDLVRHHAFQTATVRLADGRRVDFATARSEVYRRGGALPEVTPGTLEQDLERRDFTINTMALSLVPERVGEIADPCGGQADLRDGQIRFLHAQSFRDDPTRLLRALRFALRLRYEIELRTAAGIRAAAQGGFLADVTGERLQRELAKLLDEQPVRGPQALLEWELLDSIMPGLRVPEATLRRLREMDPAALGLEPERTPWRVLAVTAEALGPQERWDLVRRLRLPRDAQRIVVGSGAGWARGAAALAGVAADAPPSAIAAVLDEFDPDVVLVAAARQDDAVLRGRLLDYLGRDRRLSPELDGEQVKAMGCPDGRAVGQVLAALRGARMDGLVADAEDERALARRLIKASN